MMNYFTDTYLQARESFLKAAQYHEDATHHIYCHPSECDSLGEPLTTDVIRIGPQDASSVLLVTSGLHGAEGFAGSAIQNKILSERPLHPLPDDMALVLVHAINPYGFDHVRRVNEDNIDLNRNFIDWSASKPEEHFLTAKMQNIIAPQSWNWPLTYAKSLLMVAWHGMRNVQASLQQGQYSFPQGLFYGGEEAAWSNHLVRDVVEGCVEKGARRIVHVDIHTGLGKRGSAELILTEPSDSPMGYRAWSIWGDAVKSVATEKDESVSAKVSGSIEHAFSEAVRDKCEVTMIALEFGTLPPFGVLKAMAYDNWVHTQGLQGAERERAKAMMREAFSPRDPAWELDVLSRGTEVLVQATESLEKSL